MRYGLLAFYFTCLSQVSFAQQYLHTVRSHEKVACHLNDEKLLDSARAIIQKKAQDTCDLVGKTAMRKSEWDQSVTEVPYTYLDVCKHKMVYTDAAFYCVPTQYHELHVTTSGIGDFRYTAEDNADKKARFYCNSSIKRTSDYTITEYPNLSYTLWEASAHYQCMQ